MYLVGGGPGHPGLLTLRGAECLKRCEAVIYDALVNPALLAHCPSSAKRIFVGKRRRHHEFEQDEINALLLKYASKGKIVCRLKGGDPFLFGRGGEEAEFLFEHGVRFEVVPGVSSVIAAPACAGIPLTHRDYASHVTIVTGQNSRLGDAYRYLPKKTLVVLMGFARAGDIAKKMVSLGWPPSTPVALICSGTLASQAVITGTLSDFNEKIDKSGGRLSSPAMIVAGDVVKMREKCGSF